MYGGNEFSAVDPSPLEEGEVVIAWHPGATVFVPNNIRLNAVTLLVSSLLSKAPTTSVIRCQDIIAVLKQVVKAPLKKKRT